MSILEESILGAILDAEGQVMRSNAAVLLDVSGMRPEDFAHPKVRLVWSVLMRLVNRRKRVDPLALYAAGHAAKLLAEPDLQWLEQLQAKNTVDRERFIELADQVRNTTRSNKALTAIKERIAAIEAGTEVEESWSAIGNLCQEHQVQGMADGTGDEDVLSLMAEIDQRDTKTSPVLMPTGIDALDAVIRGWVNGLNIVCGLPSVGKSALLGTCIENELRMGYRVGIFGLEDGTRWLPKRLMARDIQVPVRDLVAVKHSPEKQEELAVAANGYTNLLRNMVTYRHESIASDELERRAVNWIVNRGVQVIYVDHAGEVEHQKRAQADDAYRLAVAWTYRRLRNIGLKYSVPIVVLAHTNRESAGKFGEEPRAPRLNEIVESREIEGMARLALGLWRVEDEPDHLRCTVLKQTEGEPNVALKLKRLTTSALIDPHDGERFSPYAERMAKFKAAKAAKDAEKAAERAARNAAKAAEKARAGRQGTLEDA